MHKNRRALCWGTALGLVLSGALSGCDKKERTVAAPPPGLAPIAAGSAGSAGAVHQPSAAPAMPMDHPSALHGRSEGPEPAAAGTSGVLRGSLQVADSVKDKVQPGAVIFLVARSFVPGGGPGPVLAAKRLTAGAWPMAFEMSDSDVMISGMSLRGKVVLTARVDQDGDAMTKMPGDVEGVTAAVDVPSSNVDVVINTVRTTAAGAPSPANMGGGMGQMPPGHSAMGMPAGHPPTELPAGHPTTGMPAGHPVAAPIAPASSASTVKPPAAGTAKPVVPAKPAGTKPGVRPIPPKAAPAVEMPVT